MREIIGKIRELLGPTEQKKVRNNLLIGILHPLFQLTSVFSVLPFMMVALSPEKAVENSKLKFVYDAFAFQSTTDFIIALGVCSFVLLLVANVYQFFFEILSIRQMAHVRVGLEMDLYKQYLLPNYDKFLERDVSRGKNQLITEVHEVVNFFIFRLCSLAVHCLTLFLLVSALIWAEPILALSTFVLFSLFYALVYLFIRPKLKAIGQETNRLSTNRLQTISESFSAIKELKILGQESEFIRRYHGLTSGIAKKVEAQRIANIVPHYIIETFTFGVILLATAYLLYTAGSASAAIPTLVFYAFACHRLAPVFRMAFSDMNAIRKVRPSFNSLYTALVSLRMTTSSITDRSQVPPLPFKRQIELTDVGYTYAQGQSPALSHVNLTINAHSSVGIVGLSGAGKTTLINIVTGLLSPTHGSLAVDGVKLETMEQVIAWQKNIGYVSQDFFLFADTIAANIAVCSDPTGIDFEQMREAIDLAQLRDYVDSLPKGWNTQVGEAGVNLSGGQRQRLAIARALYSRPSLLVLDEATSSLDTKTEAAVHQAIEKLRGTMTILVVSHRMQLVRDCDEIQLLSGDGRIQRGSYTELAIASHEFQELIAGGSTHATSDCQTPTTRS